MCVCVWVWVCVGGMGEGERMEGGVHGYKRCNINSSMTGIEVHIYSHAL